VPPSFLASFLASSMEVTTEPPPDISEPSPISLETRARARWGADAGYGRPKHVSFRLFRLAVFWCFGGTASQSVSEVGGQCHVAEPTVR
jgi:hypothetical protein